MARDPASPTGAHSRRSAPRLIAGHSSSLVASAPLSSTGTGALYLVCCLVDGLSQILPFGPAGVTLACLPPPATSHSVPKASVPPSGTLRAPVSWPAPGLRPFWLLFSQRCLLAHYPPPTTWGAWSPAALRSLPRASASRLSWALDPLLLLCPSATQALRGLQQTL